MKKEAKLNTILNQYLREKKMYCFYELKQVTHLVDVFRFSTIEKVQWEGLKAVEANGLVYKLSDETSRPKPCDGLSVPALPAYLVIAFLNKLIFIRFKEIVKLQDEGRISIKQAEAEKIAELIVKI